MSANWPSAAERRDAHQRAIARPAPKSGSARLDQRKRERQHQREMADLDDHDATDPEAMVEHSATVDLSAKKDLTAICLPTLFFQRPCAFSASATSLGMYRSSCLARSVSARNIPPPSTAPSTTTPCPSRKRSGTMPE